MTFNMTYFHFSIFQGKIAKDARECVQECVSEFISFITSEASDRCQAEKRKTINGEDILFAMSTLGFDNYVEPLKLYLQKYRESMKGEKQPGDGFEEIDDVICEIICILTLRNFFKAEQYFFKKMQFFYFFTTQRTFDELVLEL